MAKELSPDQQHGFWAVIQAWLDRNIYELAREMRVSYIPPMMIYLAAGISGLTSIVGTFFVKDYLGLSAQFLASLGFWVMIPWTLKMPIGHLVDLLWRHKAKFIYFGASLIAASLLIMLKILAEPKSMGGTFSVEIWYVIAAVLAPIGYVIQDTVADAMTVEAVPRRDEHGKPYSEEQIQLGHSTMQTLGRVAVVGGTLLVALANVYWFSGVSSMDAKQQLEIYVRIYRWALLIPLVSVAGVLFAAYLRSKAEWQLAAQGYEAEQIEQMLARPTTELPEINWWILGGGLFFALFAIGMGTSDIPYKEELIFSGSLAIVLFLMHRLTDELEPQVRRQLYGTALVIFAFRAIPSSGAGTSWWMIDSLGFDQQFISTLSLISSGLALFGMFIFRRYMAERPITEIIMMLTVLLGLLKLPELGLYYGLHEWTQTHIAGFIDARFIALIDTTLESPLGQIAMIPMLAWIANSAPAKYKATYFAVMAALVNLALSLSQLITKLLNQWFIVTRQVKDAAGVVTVPADYSQLGHLLMVVMFLSLTLPLLTIYITKRTLLAKSE